MAMTSLRNELQGTGLFLTRYVIEIFSKGQYEKNQSVSDRG